MVSCVFGEYYTHKILGARIMRIKNVNVDGHNFLGLKSEETQDSHNIWSGKRGKCVEIMRAAYYDLYQVSDRGHGNDLIDQFLSALMTGNIDEFRLMDKIDLHPKIERAIIAIEAEEQKAYTEFLDTMTYAKNDGVVSGGKGRNKHLAEIITRVTYLFGEKPEDNPLLYKYPDELLRNGLDPNAPMYHREAVKNYMHRIAYIIEYLQQLPKEQFEMAFPEDDIKQEAVIRNLKLPFNRLAAEIDYQNRFVKVVDDAENNSLHYKLEEKLFSDDSHQALAKKQNTRWWKTAMFYGSIAFALVFGVGQAAIAAAAATTLLVQLAYGGFSLITNVMLAQRDVDGFLKSVVKGDLFKGLSTRLKAFVVGFGIFSVGTAVVSTGLMWPAMLALSATVLPVAPWLPAGIVAVATLVGMGCIFFGVGCAFAQALRGKTLGGMITSAIGSLKQFITPPNYNASITDAEALLASKRHELVNQNKFDNETAEANVKALKKDAAFLARKIAFLKVTHMMRHGLKVVLTAVLVPTFIAMSAIATVCLMQTSFKGTQDLLMKANLFAHSTATKIAAGLTWVLAFPMQASLATLNMTMAGKSFAELGSKMVMGTIVGVVSFFGLLFTGRLPEAIRQGVQAIKSNPSKQFMPVVRGAVQAFLTVAVAVNGYANGKYMADNSSIPIPSYVPFNEYAVKLFANTASSSSLNFFPAMTPFNGLTPKKALQDPTKPSSTARMMFQIGAGKGKEESSFDFETEAKRFAPPFTAIKRSGHAAFTGSLTEPLLNQPRELVAF